MEQFIDYETQRLVRLIENKKQFLEKLNAATMQYKHLLSEIEFLEQDILPMLLAKNLYLTDINKWVDKQLFSIARTKINSKMSGILMYYHMKDPQPIKSGDNKYLAPAAFVTNYEGDFVAPNDFMLNVSKDDLRPVFATIVPIEVSQWK